LQSSQATGQYRTELPEGFDVGDGSFIRKSSAGGFDRLFQRLGGRNFVTLQLDQSFNHQCKGQDGAKNQGPNGPTSGLYDGEQRDSFCFSRVPACPLSVRVRTFPGPRSVNDEYLCFLWITLWETSFVIKF
jgi:hypothetical protein